VQGASRKNTRLSGTSGDLTGKFLWHPQIARLTERLFSYRWGCEDRKPHDHASMVARAALQICE
jgi:hypothetical protein